MSITLIKTFKFGNNELNIYDYEEFDDFLYELKINGSTNAIGFGDTFDFGYSSTNLACARFHKLTKSIYKEELKKIRRKHK